MNVTSSLHHTKVQKFTHLSSLFVNTMQGIDLIIVPHPAQRHHIQHRPVNLYLTLVVAAVVLVDVVVVVAAVAVLVAYHLLFLHHILDFVAKLSCFVENKIIIYLFTHGYYPIQFS